MFKVGDRVRIRQWDDMEKEFGENEAGDIYSYLFEFSLDMEHLCGRTAIIDTISGEYIELVNWSDFTGETDWCFSKDMIELIEEFQKPLSPVVVIEKSGLRLAKEENNIESEETKMNNKFLSGATRVVSVFVFKKGRFTSELCLSNGKDGDPVYFVRGHNPMPVNGDFKGYCLSIMVDWYKSMGYELVYRFKRNEPNPYCD